jgi:DNA-directed RNA polymerase specialized sigma24 family protein
VGAGFGEGEFEAFALEVEPRLRRALVAAYGSDRGREAAAEALAYAWEHWDRLRGMVNPTGYLYRVGQSRTRRRKTPIVFSAPDAEDPWFEPALAGALAGLSERQRVAVVLVHGFGWSLREVAELADTAVTTVQNHLERGLARLRSALEVHEDA